jgi:hypothetical protein
MTDNQRRPMIVVSLLAVLVLGLFGHFLLISETPYSICWSKAKIVGPEEKIRSALAHWRGADAATARDCCAVSSSVLGRSGGGEKGRVTYNDFLTRGWTHFVVAPQAADLPIQASAIVDNCGRARDWEAELVD